MRPNGYMLTTKFGGISLVLHVLSKSFNPYVWLEQDNSEKSIYSVG